MDSRAAALAGLDRAGMADRRRVCRRRAGAAPVLHALGSSVLADHPRLLHRAGRSHDLAAAGRAAAHGDDGGAVTGAAQLPEQGHVQRLTDRVLRPGRPRRGGQAVRHSRVLDLAGHLLRPGGHLHRPHHARHLSDAAVHHRVAGLAHRPPHRGLAGRPRLLPQPIHRQHHRQPRPADPARHRHLHHRRRRNQRTYRPTAPPTPCCWGRSSR